MLLLVYYGIRTNYLYIMYLFHGFNLTKKPFSPLNAHSFDKLLNLGILKFYNIEPIA